MMVEQLNTLTALMDILFVLDVEGLSVPQASKDMLVALKSSRRAIREGNTALLVEQLEGHENSLVRAFAAEGLGEIGGTAVISALSQTLEDHNASISVRIAAANALQKIGHANTLPPLIRAFVYSEDTELRITLAQTIYSHEAIGWREKANQVITTLQESALYREQIDIPATLKSILPTEEQLAEDRYALTDYLISQTIGKDERMTEILARLILESAGSDPAIVEERVIQYQSAHQIPLEAFQFLQETLNNETGMDPIVSNLRENYHRPISRLNENTQQMWESTLHSTRISLWTRLVMSGLVFVAGFGVTFFSGRHVFYNDTSFFSSVDVIFFLIAGLITMLLVVYYGPLKEIRQTLTDIGVANAAFFTCVQRTLEGSNTFTMLYLRQDLRVADVREINELMGKAMDETVTALRRRDIQPFDELLDKL